MSVLIAMFGGMALLLYGIRLSGDSLQRAAGGRLRHLLTGLARTRLMAVFSGAAVTAIIQSSAATTLMLIGFVAGVPQIPANRLLVKHRAALGSSLRYFRWHAPDKLTRSVDELFRWYREGKLKPCITHRLPLAQSVEAIRLLTERRAHGKVVVEMEAA